jgi:hypothetical protein
MRRITLAGISLLILATLLILLAPAAVAEERNLGKHSQDEIKNACNAAGGELLGVSEQGSYGCEVADKGTMILCNKNQQCTGYTPARTRSEHNKILNSLKLRVKPAMATSETK